MYSSSLLRVLGRSPFSSVSFVRLLSPGRRLAIALLAAAATQGHALTVYSLESDGYPDQAAAEVARQTLAAKMSPVFVSEGADDGTQRFTVRVGHFPYEAEAILIHRAAAPVLPDFRVVKWEWDGRALETNQLPVELPLKTTALPRTAECRMDYEGWIRSPMPESAQAAISAETLDGLSAEQLMDRGRWGSGSAVRREALEHLLATYPSSPQAAKAGIALSGIYIGTGDFAAARSVLQAAIRVGSAADKSQARLSMAFLVLKQDGAAASIPAFAEVANDVASDPSHRLDAMLRIAAIHQKAREYPEAWLAYTQIERAVDTPKVLALVRMKKASIAFELLADEGRGTWNEVRALCKLAEDVADAPPNNRATARLMYAESFAKQADHAATLKEMESLLADYPDQKRERATAKYWRARALCLLGDNAGALKAYDEVLSDPVRPAEMFAAFDVKALGLRDQARILTQEGRQEEASELLSRIFLLPEQEAAPSAAPVPAAESETTKP